MKQGWIKLHRKSLDSSVWKNPNVWFVWSWMLLKASHKEYQFPFNGKDIVINEGEFITGIQSALQELPNITKQKYRSALKYLKSTDRITVKSNNKFSIITVINWHEYQNDNSQDSNQGNSQTIVKQQATNYIQEGKEYKKYKENKEVLAVPNLQNKSTNKISSNPNYLLSIPEGDELDLGSELDLHPEGVRQKGAELYERYKDNPFIKDFKKLLFKVVREDVDQLINDYGSFEDYEGV